MGAVSVVPGAIGAWRVAAVREAGGYHVDTVAEDADLTMALLRNGYRVQYEDMALAFTEAPTTANALMRQRFRWSFGILQPSSNSRSLRPQRRFRIRRAPQHPYLPDSSPLVSPFIDIMFVTGVVWYFVQNYFHPESTIPPASTAC